MLTDDEKFMHSPKLKVEDVRKFTKLNAADIIAVGFDMKKTFIFSDFDYIGGAFYENMCRMAKHITINSVRGTFGFNDRCVPYQSYSRRIRGAERLYIAE